MHKTVIRRRKPNDAKQDPFEKAWKEVTTMVKESGAESGTPDVHSGLVTILYHALQGAETYDGYIEGAEQSGDHDLAQFFRETQGENRRRAERAKQLLVRKSSG
jgi:hypothetical protein